LTYFSQLIKKSSIVSNPTFDRQKVDKLKGDPLVKSNTTTTTSYLKEFEEQKINDQSLSDFNNNILSDKITENNTTITQQKYINSNPENNIKKELIKQQKIKQIDNFIKSNEYDDQNNNQKNFKSGFNDDNNFQELSEFSLSTSLKNKENSVSEYNANVDNQTNSFENNNNNDNIQKKTYFNEIMNWVAEDNISYSANNVKEQELKSVSSKIIDDVEKSNALNPKLKDLEKKIENEKNVDYEVSIGSINLNIEPTQKKVKEHSFNTQIKSEPNYHNRLRRSYLRI